MNLKTNSKNLYYVGGCVRDEFLGIESRDVDICYEGDAIEFVQNAGYEILKIQKDIRTARVLIDNSEIDFASTRKEAYPKQGHLPVTTEIGCNLTEDLIRRDFTINSIAKSVLTGEIFDPTGGIKDLENKLLRVHHKNSFKDDPTRILRALKFSLRFGFTLEPETKLLQEDYLNNINYDMSYSRLKKELVDVFNLNKHEALNRFMNEGIYKLLSQNQDYRLPSYNIGPLIEEFEVKEPWLAYIGWMDLSHLELTKSEKKIISDFKTLITLPEDADDYEIYKLCKKSDIRSILLWILNGGEKQGLKYLRKLSRIELEINGEDLKELGFSGKQIGVIAENILKTKLRSPQMKKVEEIEMARGLLK